MKAYLRYQIAQCPGSVGASILALASAILMWVGKSHSLWFIAASIVCLLAAAVYLAAAKPGPLYDRETP